MYENGKQVNHYANKMIHKKKQKDAYRRECNRGRSSSWEDHAAHKSEYDDLHYWDHCYLSGVRKYASDCSNSVLRSKFQQEVANQDYENMYAPQNGNYRKHFDYWWTVY